jgi:bifunctional oligoribonuclease and PAP phosphatase NrnA
LFDFIKKNRDILNLSYQTAYPIYAAIMTDTGSFRFERTTPEIHRTAAAELLELNVDPSDVFDKIYDQSLFSKIKLLGKPLDSLNIIWRKEADCLYGNNAGRCLMIQTALESDTDGFVNFSLSVEFVKDRATVY